MITIISPAKNMKPRREGTKPATLPIFLDNAREINRVLRQYSPLDLQVLMKINEKLAADSFERNQLMKFDDNGTAAVETYDGIQYKYMDPHTFREEAKEFAQNHLRILSGAYGSHRPYDSIYEYRLEMMTKMSVAGKKDLYAYWGDALYEQLKADMDSSPFVVFNLASEEYGKCIRSHLKAGDRFITVLFQVCHKGSWKVQATAAKMARGQMVRYIMEHGIDTPEEAVGFCADDWCFEPELSDWETFVFRKYE